MKINAYPKIFSLGQQYVKDIFNDTVEITEKVDGSQFSFGVVDGELLMKSKNKELFASNPEKMFSKATDYVLSISERLPEGVVFYCEYLQQPRHNVLNYGSVPKNNLALFGMSYYYDFGTYCDDYEDMKKMANKLEIGIVPLLFEGKFEVKDLDTLLDRQSFLGGPKIEGIVVKNYQKPFLLGGMPMPFMAGKYVSESFKEQHGSGWAKEHKSQGRWETYKHSFTTEARWLKSIQRLRDESKLEGAPRDIGILIKEIQSDLESEYREDIKDFLWREFGAEIKRICTHGFPEFYKKYLIENNS